MTGWEYYVSWVLGGADAAGRAHPDDLLLAVSAEDAQAYPQFSRDQCFTVGSVRALEGLRFRTAWITAAAEAHPDHEAHGLLLANAALYGSEVRPTAKWTSAYATC